MDLRIQIPSKRDHKALNGFTLEFKYHAKETIRPSMDLHWVRSGRALNQSGPGPELLVAPTLGCEALPELWMKPGHEHLLYRPVLYLYMYN